MAVRRFQSGSLGSQYTTKYTKPASSGDGIRERRTTTSASIPPPPAPKSPAPIVPFTQASNQTIITPPTPAITQPTVTSRRDEAIAPAAPEAWNLDYATQAKDAGLTTQGNLGIPASSTYQGNTSLFDLGAPPAVQAVTAPLQEIFSPEINKGFQGTQAPQAAESFPSWQTDTSYLLEGPTSQIDAQPWELVTASRLTAEAMFGQAFNQNSPFAPPDFIGPEVLGNLEAFITNPKSERLKDWYDQNFGGTFESTDDFLYTLGYTEQEDGSWELYEPTSVMDNYVTSSGSYGYSSSGYPGSGGYSYAGGAGAGRYGNGLVNWRVKI